MKVKYYPCQPHCFAFGGFDMQMLSTLEAVVNAGVQAEKLDAWSRDNNFDIIHLWGVGPFNYHVIDWSLKAGKKIIATVLSPYHETLRSKAGYYYKRFYINGLTRYYKKIDLIVVVNEIQKEVLCKYYKVGREKITVIPHLVEKKYFTPPVINFSDKYGISDYVLSTGNISTRKNQYNLALACSNLKMNVVLIGNVLDGENEYGEQLEELVKQNKNIVWIKELPNASDELVAAYYNCKLYALPSRNETQPISALEAAAMKKPLLLMDRAYAQQRYYKGATLCKSPSVKDIENALKEFINQPSVLHSNTAIQYCLPENIGEAYSKCYVELVKKG